jgi:hypothetical protein
VNLPQIQDVVDLLRCTVDSRAQEVVVKALEDCKALTQLGNKLLESILKINMYTVTCI